LETKIRILRARRDSVDLRLRDHEVVEPPGPPHATPEQPLASATSRAQGDRLAVNRQIEKAIAALEAIRVDLLHIRSGIGSHDDLKSDLELACQIASADEPNPLSAPRKPAQPDAPPFVQGPNDA
jgi:hypothetical protein